MKKISTCFLGKHGTEPNLREGVPICHRPSPKRLECAHLLERVENVACLAQTQHNTIMHAHVAVVWGRGRQWPAKLAKATPNIRNRHRKELKIDSYVGGGASQK